MLNQELIIKRLALIKYLYKQGVSQSYNAEPISAFSILALHDSIEMFLTLLAEKHNVTVDKTLMDYWKKFPTLTLKESIQRLNQIRVNIKHKGLLPSKNDIETCRVNATDFFEQNTVSHFDVEFKSVSLFSLITYKSIKDYLETSQEALNGGKVEDSIENVAYAFSELLHSYERSKSDGYYYPFNFNRPFNSPFFSFDYEERRKNEAVVKHLKKLDEYNKGIQETLTIVCFGINYMKYVKFKILTPHVLRMMGGKMIAQSFNNKKWTKENCQYCIDFVLECCLKLQEFDFNIDDLMQEKVLTVTDIN